MNERVDRAIQCTTCASDFPTLVASNRGGRYSLVCRKCGASYVSNKAGFVRVSASENAEIGNLLVDQTPVAYASGSYKSFVFKAFSSRLAKIVGKVKPGVVLDIGCGNGGWSHILARGGRALYYGLEPSPIPPDQIRQRPDYCVLVQYDPQRPIPVHRESVDLVTFIASYDHIPDPQRVIPQAWMALRPGGHLLVAMTNYDFWPKRVLNWLTRRRLFMHSHEHCCVHTPGSLSDALLAHVGHLGASIIHVAADDILIPNLPRRLGWIYCSDALVRFLNLGLRASLWFWPGHGSIMFVLVRKLATGQDAR